MAFAGIYSRLVFSYSLTEVRRKVQCLAEATSRLILTSIKSSMEPIGLEETHGTNHLASSILSEIGALRRKYYEIEKLE